MSLISGSDHEGETSAYVVIMQLPFFLNEHLFTLFHSSVAKTVFLPIRIDYDIPPVYKLFNPWATT